MITTIEEARQVLGTARLDTIADHGEQGADEAHSDLVRYVADLCDPTTAEELLRREGLS